MMCDLKLLCSAQQVDQEEGTEAFSAALSYHS